MLGDFNKNFNILCVSNTELRQHYQEVTAYFTDKRDQINGKTAYDPYCVNYLLTYKRTNKIVGAVRIIFGKKINGLQLLPIEILEKKAFAISSQKYQVNYNHLAEITQFVISTHFRPKLTIIGIIRAILQSCLEEGVSDLYVALDHRIQRLLMRIGIQLDGINSGTSLPNEYFFGNIEAIIHSVHLSHPLVWDVITDHGKLCCPYKELIFLDKNK